MNWKLAACLLGVLLLAGWLLLFGTGGRGDGPRGERPSASAAQAADRLAEPATPELAQPNTSLPAAERTAPAPARSAVEVSAALPARAELAGLVGRVVESDGRPVPGLRVALLEFDGELLFDGAALDEPEPTLEVEETVTDDAGRFRLGGARAPAFHGLGLDLGGARATVRVLDHALTHREETDIGDVVLAPYGVLTGRVVDEQGAPVAGARVRCGPLPEEILAARPQDLRPDCGIAVSLLAIGGEGQRILEIPPWIGSWLERLPVPTTSSGADGRFRLEGVALAELVGGVDRRGWVGASFGPVDLSSGSHDLGDVTLSRGRTVRGVVEDSSGDPVAGAEVLAGAELVPGIVAILQACGPSDADGRFELSGVPAEGQIVAAARRAQHEPWRSVTGARHEGILIELESTVELTVNVRDEAGQPLSGADLRLEPVLTTKARGDFGQMLAFLPRPRSPRLTVAEVEPGRYRLSELGTGRYQVTARVAGRAPGIGEVDCVGLENEVTLTCAAGSPLELQVIVAGTREPVPGARATVLHAGPAGFLKLAAARTDAGGRAALGPLPDLALLERAGEPFTEQPMIRVQHPRFGEHSALIDLRVSPLVVELSAGGALAGRVHWGGATPTQLYMLTLERRDTEDFLELFALPRFTVTTPTGDFRLTNLVPGRYGVELLERFLQQDPLGLIAREIEPVTLYRGEVVIEDGKTAQLEIDLTPSGRGTTARVVGRVHFDGRPLEGANVNVSGSEDVWVTTDARGRFETPAFVVLGSSHVRIEGPVPLGGGKTRSMQLFAESMQLVQDEVRTIELDLYPLALPVRVVEDGSGRPIAGARITAQIQRTEGNRGSSGEGDVTDAEGEVRLLVLEPGEYVLNASADGFGRASAAAKVAADGAGEPVVLRLPRAVPCAGRVDAIPSEVGPVQFSYLNVRGPGGARAGTRLSPPDYAFTLEGLVPGSYTANLFLGGQQGQEVSFELGPNGDKDLVLTFMPRQW
ncbi:MAG TPA: carboxypeptidase-like regulatory domain-containing protein [Planctomycetota bacterium]